MNQISLLKPVVSEKSMKLAKDGLFTFLVNKSATKPVIAQLIENKFGVDVVEIKVANFKDERKVQRTRKGYFVVSGVKKAMLKLKKGQKIDLFVQENVAETGEETKTAEVKAKGKKEAKTEKKLRQIAKKEGESE